MDIVLVRISIDMIRHHDRHILGRKRLIWLNLPHHSSSPKEVRTGTQASQDSRGRS